MTEGETSMVGRTVTLWVSDPWEVTSRVGEKLGGRIIKDDGAGSFSIRLDEPLKFHEEGFDLVEARYRYAGPFDPKSIRAKPAAFNFGVDRARGEKHLLFVGGLQLSDRE